MVNERLAAVLRRVAPPAPRDEEDGPTLKREVDRPLLDLMNVVERLEKEADRLEGVTWYCRVEETNTARDGDAHCEQFKLLLAEAPVAELLRRHRISFINIPDGLDDETTDSTYEPELGRCEWDTPWWALRSDQRHCTTPIPGPAFRGLTRLQFEAYLCVVNSLYSFDAEQPNVLVDATAWNFGSHGDDFKTVEGRCIRLLEWRLVVDTTMNVGAVQHAPFPALENKYSQHCYMAYDDGQNELLRWLRSAKKEQLAEVLTTLSPARARLQPYFDTTIYEFGGPCGAPALATRG